MFRAAESAHPGDQEHPTFPMRSGAAIQKDADSDIAVPLQGLVVTSVPRAYFRFAVAEIDGGS